MNKLIVRGNQIFSKKKRIVPPVILQSRVVRKSKNLDLLCEWSKPRSFVWFSHPVYIVHRSEMILRELSTNQIDIFGNIWVPYPCIAVALQCNELIKLTSNRYDTPLLLICDVILEGWIAFHQNAEILEEIRFWVNILQSWHRSLRSNILLYFLSKNPKIAWKMH